MRFLLVFALIFILNSCSNNTFTITYDERNPKVSFAVLKIEESLSKASEYKTISFKLEKGAHAPQAYYIEAEDKKITISAADDLGLMYGGLEVAEQLQLNQSVENTTHTPYILKRGLKMNIPLDARTPGYDDTGDAAQQNIAHVWDWNFWKSHLDHMAINRYNVLTLWNPHPFPSMIKQEEFPDVALHDVCITTLKPTGKENEWAEPQMVSRNVVENLKVIKKIDIDQKIAFWQKVMQYAHNRGIDIYFFNWNLCANGAAAPVEPFYRTYGQPLWNEKPGKHGINNQMDNPVNVAYYRNAVATFLKTYPHVKGIGVTAGEHMMDDSGVYTREQWIWETYGLGILEAKKEMPERKVDFIHRVWNTNMDKIFKYWTEYPDSFEASYKYAKARLYATPTPNFAKNHIHSMKTYGLKSWWNLRNDDIFVHRWGNPDYVRDFINHFEKEHTAGFYMGSDGYFWGRVFNSKTPELANEMEVNKHWYRFMMWGRLAYNNKLDSNFFTKKITQRFPETNGSKLYKVWKEASKIIPEVNKFHWNNWDYQWSVEACIDARNGFHDINRFITNPTLKGSNILSPLEYSENPESTKISPYQMAKTIKLNASETLKEVEKLKNDDNSVELSILLEDLESMAYLGHYYASKINAATELALFTKTKKEQYKTEAIQLLKDCVTYWKLYSEIQHKNYKPQMLARTGNFDVYEILKQVENDVKIAESLD
ncbi:hypothetical protein [Seonamhaeicola marinus]|uniref:Carbohydrate-binding family 6 protein n=1 Tax=Seonamhaeicola marinus TaxID=1912246 RepID=A0A5D0I899_9FLAO|nr:hypothetical protein [Seonamhaeicola marinus]TYA78657.1 hypothetical protein FUA24_09910 [Seonamhaeicola marinus]